MSLEGESDWNSPVQDADQASARWLLEDHPRLQGRAADPIAQRIQQRLSDLAVELRAAVFGPMPALPPVVDPFVDEERMARLAVVIEEPVGAPWTPWELMLAPFSGVPLSIRAASFSRTETGSANVPATPVESESTQGSAGLRVLLITSRPDGEGDVPFRSVASRMVQAVASSPGLPVQIEILRPPTYPAFQTALAAAVKAGTPFDVVHFDGHGSYRNDPLNPGVRRGTLLFEGDDGVADGVTGDLIGEDLVQFGVRYLVLNACRSAYTEAAAPPDDPSSEKEHVFGSLASEVRSTGVQGVLAMGFNLYVVTAARLMADTYAALAAGRDLAQAVGHARRRLFQNQAGVPVGVFDWLVPCVLQDEPARDPLPATEIAELPVRKSATTPTSPRVIDLDAPGTPRSDERSFFGYDTALWRLDRACTNRTPVEIVGLTGAGKSALAAEFARWWAATTPGTAVVLDLAPFATFHDFETVLQSRLLAAGNLSSEAPRLLVLDGAGDLLAAENDRWPEADRISLRTRLQEWQCIADALVLTGRIPTGMDGAETIPLSGLDVEARTELAAEIGFGPEQASALPGLLPWSQGVPAVVLQLPRIAASSTVPGFAAGRRLMTKLRSGKLEPASLGLALMEHTGMRFFDVRRLRRAALPLILHLFQERVGTHQWTTFCQMTAAKGFDLAKGSSPEAVLKEEMYRAEREGLAARIPDGFQLHPLAPLAIEPGLAGTVQVLTRGDADQQRALFGLVFGTYIQSVTVQSALASAVVPAGGHPPGPWRSPGENLWNAIEIALMGRWWGLALPLLHQLRDRLRSEARDAEWRGILSEVGEIIQNEPPEPSEMGFENPTLHLIRLAAEEAERDGDHQLAKSLRERQLRLANSEDVVLEPLNPGDGPVMDIGRIRRIAALLKNGDVAAGEGSDSCLGLYDEALRLATEAHDVLRAGEVHLAIAKAHVNVEPLRDLAKYEDHARQARSAGLQFGPLGRDLTLRASVSVGIAIVLQQARLKTPDPARCQEAQDALEFALAEPAADAPTLANAHHGLGMLFMLQENFPAAADEFLACSNEFEKAADHRSGAFARIEAAYALVRGGQMSDARALTSAILEDLDSDTELLHELLPALHSILEATASR